MKSIIVTTIHPPSNSLKQFSKLSSWNLISVGDLKTPEDWNMSGVKYLAPREQFKLFPKFSDKLKWNRYARKNIGYLYAIKQGAKIIAEIDDDITPYKNFPPDISKNKKILLISGEKFVNIYHLFDSKYSWPRGFPINRILKKQQLSKKMRVVFSPIQNSLLDQNGDFDAIYRLVSDKNVIYKKSGQYALNKGVYCPFHSGNTFWYPESFMLLYLPAYTNPHVEDIWRGYIAQRLLWEIHGNLTFIYPTVYTNQRNKHDYVRDFEFELPLFLQTEKLISILDSLSLNKDLGDSLIKTYKVLVKEGLMQKEEMIPLTEWVKNVESFF